MSCPAIPADPTPFRGLAARPLLFQITAGPSFTGDSPVIPYYTGTRVQIAAGATTYALSVPTGVALYDPTLDRVGGQEGNQELADGDWVYAQYDQDTQRWVILQGSHFKIRRIQLTSDMSSGSCSAKVLAWNSSAYAVTGSSFTVYDSQSAFPTAISGLNGFAIYEPDRAAWEIVFVPSGLTYIGVLAGALSAGGSATVNRYTGTPGSEASTGTDTVYDWMMKSGDSIPSGTRIMYAVVNGRKYVINAACP